jgi:pyruvate, water dikinase
MKKYIVLYCAILVVCLLAPGLILGAVYEGRVLDAFTNKPVAGAQVRLIGTGWVAQSDHTGRFSIFTDDDLVEFDHGFRYSVQGNKIHWQSEQSTYLTLSNLAGQQLFTGRKAPALSGSISLEPFPVGVYLLRVNSGDQQQGAKILKTGSVAGLAEFRLKSLKTRYSESAADTLAFSAPGYFDHKIPYSGEEGPYKMVPTSSGNIDYLTSLPSPQAYKIMQSVPLIPAFGEVESIKLVYSIQKKTLYYINSKKYLIHYDFAKEVLGYYKGHYLFNQEQYTTNQNRIYYLATLNHFKSSDIYTLEFFSGDGIRCEEIEVLYQKIMETSFIGNGLMFYSTNDRWSSCTALPTISSEELYKGQNFQSLNPGEGYGYLKKIGIHDLDNEYIGRHDVVLTNGIPNDMPVTAGIITTEFQTPLSHINVLSHNRGTPNMALRDGWTNQQMNSLAGKLVYLNVTLDSFYIRGASLPEAQTFWSAKEPTEIQTLDLDTLPRGLIDLELAGVEAVASIGGKAANFAEVKKIRFGDEPLPMPEGDFAIPVYYYWKHLKKRGLDRFIQAMLTDVAFMEDAKYRALVLEQLRDSIRQAPIDPELLNLVYLQVSQSPGFTNWRFRSSTNAEDIEGFNGAGLYDSYTGIPGHPDKTIERAIKKVWASLWNFRAFEEREYFRIDHTTVAMAVLCHRSFPSEVANGVAITENLYNPNNAAVTINVQWGEMSIVNPEENYLPDGIIYYLLEGSFDNTVQYISHSTVPGTEGKTVMTPDELRLLRDYCMAIHNHFCEIHGGCKTMDIEFKVDVVGGIRKLYIKQARLY